MSNTSRSWRTGQRRNLQILEKGGYNLALMNQVTDCKGYFNIVLPASSISMSAFSTRTVELCQVLNCASASIDNTNDRNCIFVVFRPLSQT